jgi:hypothetical protein
MVFMGAPFPLQEITGRCWGIELNVDDHYDVGLHRIPSSTSIPRGAGVIAGPDLRHEAGADGMQPGQRGVDGVHSARGAAAGVRVRLGAGQPDGQPSAEVIDLAGWQRGLRLGVGASHGRDLRSRVEGSATWENDVALWRNSTMFSFNVLRDRAAR